MLADSTAPSAPTSLSTNTILSNQLNLLWTASIDVGVTNYLIYRNGSLIDTIGNTTNYTVYGLTPSTAYNFTVYARDAAGNISAVSNTATATTTRLLMYRHQLLQIYSNITSNALTISWTASTDDYGISQYHIFANSSTTALVVINTQSTGTVTYNVTGLSPSTSYYFRIFARDIDGNFSAPGQSATINTAAAPAGPAPTGLYANTLVTQKYLQGGMQQQEQRVCLVSFY
jgi:chitodextrinase